MQVSAAYTGFVDEAEPRLRHIRVTAKPASADSLELVACLVTDTSRVPVRGATGVLGTYGESKQLSWIDDQGAMVTIMATDPSVDLVAMAESEPPAPWSQVPGQTVLTGTREGRTWSVRVVPDAQRGYDVCWELGGVDVVTPSKCAGGAVWFSGVGYAPLPIDGCGFFVGGAVPSCAAQVRSGSRTIATVEGTDGRRFFGTWDLNPQALLDPGTLAGADGWQAGTLEALDAAGATVGTWSPGDSGWRDDRC